MNNRQKKMGYNAARELLHNLGMTDEIIPEEKEWSFGTPFKYLLEVSVCTESALISEEPILR
jgi:hypothetical protein